ncbi:MAG: phosphoribosylamine--glycine ligase [Deltaproteobacteria bacterium]|nr:phosphoribosylamine--glycine ligase [Deltaproteobacteria bacterium]
MKILLVGSGGREHAMAWKITSSPMVDELLCVPGSDAILSLPKAKNSGVDQGDLVALADYASKQCVDLTVIGPEAPLVDGITDEFAKRGLKVFGPSKRAAMLEGSKIFCKELLLRNNIPTAGAEFYDDYEKAASALENWEPPVVVKADGLAAGKGVVVCDTRDKAREALKSMLVDKTFGAAGERVIIEECLVGEEASFIAITDGEVVLPLAGSQDHKRVDDGDKGPNTGGMGAYSPAPVLDKAMSSRVYEEIMLPTVRAMAALGTPFMGTLYAGLMITGEGPKVLEFNVRFGDPETQPLLFRLESDLASIMSAAVDGGLKKTKIKWNPQTAVCVVAASGGYPGHYDKGKEITGLGELEGLDDVYVFHAGTKLKDGRWYTNGGRVLGVTARGQGARTAVEKAYLAMQKIKFEGMHFRKDIGKKAIERP